MLKVCPQEQAVTFDGVFDVLSSGGSASAGYFDFVHNLFVFTIFALFRRRGGTRANTRSPLGNCQGQAGFNLGFDVPPIVDVDTSLGESNIKFLVGSGAGLVINYSSAQTVKVGVPTKLMIGGDGANLYLSKDFYNFEKAAKTGALPGSPVSAFYDLSLGAANPTPATANEPAELDWFRLLVYNRSATSFTIAERLSVKQEFDLQIGALP